MSAANNVVPLRLTARDIESAPRFPCWPDDAEKCRAIAHKLNRKDFIKELSNPDPAKAAEFLEKLAKRPIPSSWQRIASADPHKLEQWGEKYPGCNWGMPTGKSSGVFVFDVDNAAALEALEAEIGKLPETLTAETPRGGKHLYFADVDGLKNLVGFRPGLDVRTGGGYVLVGPSTVGGKPYRWVNPDAQIMSAPAQLIEQILAGKRKDADRELPPLRELHDHDGRNERIHDEGCSLWAAGYTKDALWDALKEYSRELGTELPEPELRQIYESIIKLERVPPTTELGFAERIAEQYGQDLRWVPKRGWFVWDGKRWTASSDKPVRAATTVARDIHKEVKRITSEGYRKAIKKFAKECEAWKKINSAIELLKSIDGIEIGADKLDANALVFQTENGVLEFDKGSVMFREPRREDYITKMANVEYDPAATCPRWEQFMQEVFPDDSAMVAYKQRVTGYTLTGLVSEHCLWMHQGGGRNGKTTEMNVLIDMWGDYAKVTPSTTLIRRQYSGIPNDLAALVGARLVSCSEANEDSRLDEAKIKLVTGAGEIPCRFLGKEFFSYLPALKIFFEMNTMPDVNDLSDAIWSRIRAIHYPRRFMPDEIDKNLEEKLRAEKPGILNWAIQGYLDYRRRGKLDEPASVSAATSEYREANDMLGAWIDQRCKTDVAPNAFVQSSDMFNDYVDWHKAGQFDLKTRLNQNKFKEHMKKHGHPFKRHRYVGPDGKVHQATATLGIIPAFHEGLTLQAIEKDHRAGEAEIRDPELRATEY